MSYEDSDMQKDNAQGPKNLVLNKVSVYISLSLSLHESIV